MWVIAGWVVAYVLVGNAVAVMVFAAVARGRAIPAGSGAPLVFAFVTLSWPAWVVVGVLMGVWGWVARIGGRGDRQGRA